MTCKPNLMPQKLADFIVGLPARDAWELKEYLDENFLPKASAERLDEIVQFIYDNHDFVE